MKFFLAAFLPLAAASTLRFPVSQDDIRFNSVNSIKSSQIGDLFSALNGYTVHSQDAWKGIRSYNPLRHPTLFFIVDFRMPKHVGEMMIKSDHEFKLENNNLLENEFDRFRDRAVERQPSSEGTFQLIDVDNNSDDDEARRKEAEKLLGTESFDSKVDADRQFLLEYYTLKQTLALVNSSDVNASPSNVYWLILKSLRTLAEQYGATHEKPQRAMALFGKLIGTATGIIKEHPRSLFVVVQSTEEPQVYTRSKREVSSNNETFVLAHAYNSDFHVVFAMVTFTLLVFFLGVFATSIGLWFMDPGRDSIIYRMTSQRMKME